MSKRKAEKVEEEEEEEVSRGKEEENERKKKKIGRVGKQKVIKEGEKIAR